MCVTVAEFKSGRTGPGTMAAGGIIKPMEGAGLYTQMGMFMKGNG